MKALMKVVCLLMVLTVLLCGCSEAKETTPAQTQAPEPAAITTEADLTAALQGTGRVVLGADLELTAEVIVNGQILDCGGHTLTGPTYEEGKAESENGITVTGGTVENVTVQGDYRCIGDRKGQGANHDVRLKNVTVNGDTYALNFGYGNGQASLYVENSTLRGWSSYTKFQQAIFTNCTFSWSESGANGNLRPYINTTLIGCKFESKTEADGTVTPFNLSFRSGTDGVSLILENCYVGDTLITQENIGELLNVQAYGNIVMVRNTAA